LIPVNFSDTIANMRIKKPTARPWDLLALALLLSLTGCGTSPPVLTVAPLQAHNTLTQTFTQAYTTRDAAGDYQIVLLDDPIDRASPGDAGRPLTPARLPPVRQVLQIRVLWRPVSGAKPDSPAATNASLHWYVLSGPTTAGTSMVHYAGTAFVAVVPNGPGAEITIGNGLLKVVEHDGELTDPLNSFKLSGRFDAVADDARLQQIINDTRTAAAEARGGAQAKVTGP
jgi:hypothetical protein